MSAETTPAELLDEAKVMEEVVSLCKRRGFIFQASEIYGGLRSCYDYGPAGVELKRNVKALWWRDVVTARSDVVGLDSAILQSPRVWEASGHLEGFTDPLVDCKDCRKRFRADHLDGDTCPECGGALTDARDFNLMFQTHMGPVEEEGTAVYLRPETAQGIFTNFSNVLTSARMKPPFGIAQIGKSFRNEITPGNFVFRMREFEQMEMEFFVPPNDEQHWYEHWKAERMDWYVRYGADPGRLRWRDHDADELAHYSTACADIEYRFPFGWSELEGVACRTDFDLKRHQEASGKDLSYFDQQEGERYLPWVIEPAAGVDRAALTFLVDAYDREDTGKEIRTVLRLHPELAPVQVAVFPLVRKEGMPEKADEIVAALRGRFRVATEAKQSIGKRYRRQDELGTPFCVTVDGDTITDDTVTVRDRDSMEQERVPVAELETVLAQRAAAWSRSR